MSDRIMAFPVIDTEAWQQFVDSAPGDLERGIVRYAAHWANLMEQKMLEGSSLEDIASETSRRADLEGITPFMYGSAVSILSHWWQHGEELRRWHKLDTQPGKEGEAANGGMFNPALYVSSPEDD